MMLSVRSRWLLPLFSGLLLGAGWYGWGIELLVFIGFVPLLYLDEFYYRNREKYASFRIFPKAYAGFFLLNLTTTWWIWNASDFGAIMAIVCNSLFMAIVFWLYHYGRRYLSRTGGYVLLIIFWTGFEYLHFNWDLSWTWLTMGNAMAPSPSLVQWYEFTGTLGGTVWILLVNIFVFTTLLHYVERKKRKVAASLWAVLGVLLIPVLFSLIRYYTWEEKGEVYKVVVIQPNIDPYNEKFAGMDVLKQLERITDLADSKAGSVTDFIVAPETAIPNGIWEEDFKVHPYINYLKKWMGQYPDAQLIIGASTYHTYGPGESPSVTARKFNDGNAWYDSYNTALQIDCTGVNAVYHKSKLVLGVESMPFPETLSFLEEIVIDLGGTSGSLGKQKEAGVFHNPKNKGIVAPVICYESVYGEYVTGYIAKGANLIFVITNDGWWGDTPGYRQHLTFSSLRAIETRKAIARSANTGISCFINQRGDILHATPWWEQAVISADIAANPDDTFYVRNGDYIGRICGYASLLAVAGLLILILVKKIRKQ